MAGARGDDGELKLLGIWASPNTARVKLALHLKGLSYEYLEQDLDNKSELLLRSNPVHKLVPVLIHDGNPVCESQVILQYLDDAFPGTGAGPSLSLLPADPYDRAVARFWAAFVDDKLLAPWRASFRAKTGEEKAECRRQMAAAADALEGGLQECSQGNGFFGGDRVGYVDVLLGGMVPWVRTADKISGEELFDAGKAPLLAAWMERFGQLDAAKAVFQLQDVDSLVEYAGVLGARAARLSAAAAATK